MYEVSLGDNTLSRGEEEVKSRVTFIEKSSFAFVLYNKECIGFINFKGFAFYDDVKRTKNITWRTFTDNEKELVEKQVAEIKRDKSAWGM